MHLHIRAELPGGGLRPGLAGLLHQIVEQLLGLLRWCGGGEAGAQALAGIGGEGELGYQQQPALHILHRAVHAPFAIGKHPVVEQFVQQPVGAGPVVLRLDADQHQQALIDSPDNLPGDLDPGLADPLQ